MSPLKGLSAMNSDVSFEEDDINSSEEDDFDDENDDSINLSAPTEPREIGQKCKLDQSKKTKSKKLKTLPITTDELIYLKETENLFQSNVFRLQIAELLNETKPKRNYKRHFNTWFQDFNNFLQSLTESKEYELLDFSWLKKRTIRLPLNVNENLTGTFKFVKPMRTLVVGSFKNGTTLGSPLQVDVVLVMPKSIFKKSDKFDEKYFIKRGLYLCYLAKALKKSQLLDPDSTINFTNKHGDALKPCLILKPNCKSSKHMEIVIQAVPETGVFKLEQFTPDKSNTTVVSKEEVAPTPHYNSSLCEDLVLEEIENLKNSVFESNKDIKDAAVLLGVWLKQRSLSQGYGGFHMHIACMYLVYLFKTRRINSSMSSNQIIRIFWLDLTRNDWSEKGLSLKEDLEKESLANLFHKQYEVVFRDSSGFHNIAFRMSRTTYKKVKREAEFALKLLNTADGNCFSSLFLKKVPFLHQHDNVLCFTDPSVISRTVESHASTQDRTDFCHQNVPIFVNLLSKLIEKGLNSRLNLMSVNWPNDSRWNISQPPPSYELTDSLMIGLQFNPEESLSLIDRGPPSNSPEGAEFREFWGDKCQLRRFKDGSVTESVIWANTKLTIEERRKIVKDILVYLMDTKLKITETDFSYIGLQLSSLSQVRFSSSRSLEESYVALHRTFTRLSQDLYSLTLPLQIISIHCISESYRFADPFPPLKSHFVIAKDLCESTERGLILQKGPDAVLPPFTPCVDLVVQMSISSKWPNDIKACKRLVAAFYLEIADAFRNVKRLKTQASPNYVIVLKDNFIFKIHLAYSKEIALLKEQRNELGLKRYTDTEESIALERQFVNLPKLSSALYGVSQLHSAFGPTCVLAKKWLSSQLFHETHFPRVVVELLVAYMFLSSQPVEVTTRPLAMFLRFLNILASTNWHVEPIIVNFTETLDKAGIADIEKHFTTNRETLPPMFVATSFDNSGSLWTKKAPTLPVLIRIAKLASASQKILETCLVSKRMSSQLLKMFTPPLSVFHLVIRVNLKMVTRRHHRIDFDEVLPMKNLKSDFEQIPVHNFDPVAKYIELLETNYSNEALFFYDEYGGTDIGVVLKEDFLQDTLFKVSSFEGRQPVRMNGEIVMKPNLKALIDGFQVIGRGLVEEVVSNLK